MSASVSSSGHASTTTAMFASLSRNGRGNLRNARSTNASNCRLVIRGKQVSAALKGRRPSEAANALDVDDVGYIPDRGHDALQLRQIRHFDHEVIDTAPVV